MVITYFSIINQWRLKPNEEKRKDKEKEKNIRKNLNTYQIENILNGLYIY